MIELSKEAFKPRPSSVRVLPGVFWKNKPLVRLVRVKDPVGNDRPEPVPDVTTNFVYGVDPVVLKFAGGLIVPVPVPYWL